MNSTSNAQFDEAQRECLILVADQLVDPWRIAVAPSDAGVLPICISIGRLVLEHELEQATGEIPDDLARFVFDDARSNPALAMNAYLAIVRGASMDAKGVIAIYRRWQRKRLRPSWIWTTVESVSIGQERDTILIKGRAVTSTETA